MRDSMTDTVPIGDSELWAAYVAGDESAFVELERRWRPYLVEYTRNRGAEAIVDDVFARLRGHSGEMDCVRFALFATAHHLAGTAGDWRDGMPLLVREAPL